MASYCGRFAPSPTGPLHLGSLFAAVLSYVHARQHAGQWQVRIEDLDPPREQAGAANSILHCLQAHGLRWDALSYQSQHHARYQATLEQLGNHHLIYACPCSRKQLQQNNGQHISSCPRHWQQDEDCAIRLHCAEESFQWQDLFRGEEIRQVEQDFVLRRRDGLWAYQLAVVADDAAQGITHVIRGADLLDSSPMQLALYRALALKPPMFGHFPVLTRFAQKLSKQNHAPAVDPSLASDNLRKVLQLLGLPLETLPLAAPPEEYLALACERWHPASLCHCSEIPLNDE